MCSDDVTCVIGPSNNDSVDGVIVGIFEEISHV